MSELSVLNLGKWIHSFVQNLTFQVSPIYSKKMDKINFTCYVDVNYHINFEFIAEILKDIAKKNPLDVTDIQSVYHFIEKQTKFLDKCVYSENIFLSMYHYNHINKKIVQNIRDTKINKNTRERKAIISKTKSSKQTREAVNDYSQIHNAKPTRTVISDQKFIDLSLIKPRNVCLKELDVTRNITAYIRQKTELNKRHLQFYINDVEFRRNVHVTLYIASKTLYDVQYHSDIPHLKRNKKKLNYQHVLMLCKHAILCLIDPSKKASLYIENNLSVIIQNHLLQGCIYHFDSTSNTKNYSALLILSERAKSLVKHPNTIMLRTISAILKCNINDILVLSHHLDDNCI